MRPARRLTRLVVSLAFLLAATAGAQAPPAAEPAAGRILWQYDTGG